MTAERRYVAKLADIRAITFKCKGPKCSASLSVSPDEIIPEKVQYCPACSHKWWSMPQGAIRHPESKVYAFLSSIGPLREQDADLGFTICFEFDEPR